MELAVPNSMRTKIIFRELYSTRTKNYIPQEPKIIFHNNRELFSTSILIMVKFLRCTRSVDRAATKTVAENRKHSTPSITAAGVLPVTVSFASLGPKQRAWLSSMGNLQSGKKENLKTISCLLAPWCFPNDGLNSGPTFGELVRSPAICTCLAFLSLLKCPQVLAS